MEAEELVNASFIHYIELQRGVFLRDKLVCYCPLAACVD